MADPSDSYKLPMLRRYPILAGVLTGIALRLIFSGPGGSDWSPMVGAFIFLTPFAIGMVTVYLAERRARRNWKYWIAAPMLANTLFVMGTLALLIEGLICTIVIVPMFAAIGAVGGLTMGFICRLTKWPRQSMYCAGALPLIVAALGSAIPTPDRIGTIERSVLINARPDIVWNTINSIAIEDDEMDDVLARRIGVPMPQTGHTEIIDGERLRRSRWGKQVYFDEVIEVWEPSRYLRWSYRFSEDSFPKGALDDHVLIGGHYFDLVDSDFRLNPGENEDQTRLVTTTNYRISTQFNFYADWVAQLLIGNLNEAGLAIYKRRSESAEQLHEAPDA